MSFGKALSNAVAAYYANLRLISFFSIPLLIAFPLLMLLPNYAALGGIFLRLGSLGVDVSLVEISYMLAVLCISLLLFSFGIVAVNSVIKAQRTFTKLKHVDLQRMEEATFRLFLLLLVVFAAVFAFNLLLYETQVEERVRVVLNSLFALAASLLVLFAPQAIVLDHARTEHSLLLSASLLSKKPLAVFAFLLLGGLLTSAISQVFTSLQPAFYYAPLVGLAINSLVLIPFLEVLKVQIYLTKYSLL